MKPVGQMVGSVAWATQVLSQPTAQQKESSSQTLATQLLWEPG